VWGLDMYRALARSRVTLNRHINVAENNANNMRLYEATGVGALLITDRKDNLGELFEVGKEVVAYSSPEEAAELIRYYIAHPEEARAIALAGQARTLREHTYKRRMEELVPVLERYLTQEIR
jgi:spore maturation protein CgeB